VDSLGELLNKMPQRHHIEAVALDMWEPFIKAVGQYLPQANIVHDKFHIAKYLGEAVDKVRKQENRSLVKGTRRYPKRDKVSVAD
jgi:transposase